MDGIFDEIDSRVNEEIETTEFFDHLFSMIKLIVGILGIAAVSVAIYIWLR